MQSCAITTHHKAYYDVTITERFVIILNNSHKIVEQPLILFYISLPTAAPHFNHYGGYGGFSGSQGYNSYNTSGASGTDWWGGN